MRKKRILAGIMSLLLIFTSVFAGDVVTAKATEADSLIKIDSVQDYEEGFYVVSGDDAPASFESVLIPDGCCFIVEKEINVTGAIIVNPGGRLEVLGNGSITCGSFSVGESAEGRNPILYFGKTSNVPITVGKTALKLYKTSNDGVPVEITDVKFSEFIYVYGEQKWVWSMFNSYDAFEPNETNPILVEVEYKNVPQDVNPSISFQNVTSDNYIDGGDRIKARVSGESATITWEEKPAPTKIFVQGAGENGDWLIHNVTDEETSYMIKLNRKKGDESPEDYYFVEVKYGPDSPSSNDITYYTTSDISSNLTANDVTISGDDTVVTLSANVKLRIDGTLSVGGKAALRGTDHTSVLELGNNASIVGIDVYDSAGTKLSDDSHQYKNSGEGAVEFEWDSTNMYWKLSSSEGSNHSIVVNFIPDLSALLGDDTSSFTFSIKGFQNDNGAVSSVSGQVNFSKTSTGSHTFNLSVPDHAVKLGFSLSNAGKTVDSASYKIDNGEVHTLTSEEIESLKTESGLMVRVLENNVWATSITFNVKLTESSGGSDDIEEGGNKEIIGNGAKDVVIKFWELKNGEYVQADISRFDRMGINGKIFAAGELIDANYEVTNGGKGSGTNAFFFKGDFLNKITDVKLISSFTETDGKKTGVTINESVSIDQGEDEVFYNQQGEEEGRIKSPWRAELPVTEGTTEEYNFLITELQRGSIVWTGATENNYHGYGQDAYVENGKVQLVSIMDGETDLISNYSADVNEDSYDLEKNEGYIFAPVGSTVTVRLVPDYGYQVIGAELNGVQELTAETTVSTFSFVMPENNVHFRGVFTASTDKITTPASEVSSATIGDASNAATSGNLSLNVADNMSYAKTEEAKTTALNGDTTKVATTVATLDMTLDNIVNKNTDASYWTTPVTEFTSPITVGLKLKDVAVDDGEELVVVREHNGTLEKIDATYDTTTGTLSVPTNRFSTYSIVKLGKKDVSNAAIAFDRDSFTYDGTAKEPTITIDGAALDLSKFTVTYTNSSTSDSSKAKVFAGTVTVRVTAKVDNPNYTGYQEKTYTIAKATPTITLSNLSETTQAPTGVKATLSPADATAVVKIEYGVLDKPAVAAKPEVPCNVAHAENCNSKGAGKTIADCDCSANHKTHTTECGYQAATAAQNATYNWSTTRPTAPGTYKVRASLPTATTNLVAVTSFTEGTYTLTKYTAPSGGGSNNNSGTGSGSSSGGSSSGSTSSTESKPVEVIVPEKSDKKGTAQSTTTDKTTQPTEVVTTTTTKSLSKTEEKTDEKLVLPYQLAKEEPVSGTLQVSFGEGTIEVNVESQDEKGNTKGDVITGVALGSLDNVLNAVLTEEEKEIVKAGNNVEVRLSMKKLTQEIPVAEQTAMVELVAEKSSKIPGLTIGTYMDISMEKKLGNKAWENVTNLNEEVEITIDIPKDLQMAGAQYWAVKNHAGVVTLLEDLDDKEDTLTIKTGEFSTYAIAYAVSNVEDADGVESVENVSVEEVQTQEAGLAWYWWLLPVAVVVIAIVGYTVYKKNSSDEE